MKKGHKMTEYERICHHFSISKNRPSSSTVKKIKERLGNTCAVCGINDSRIIELDHIIPLYKGGKNDINNFQCLCSNHHTIKTYEDRMA